MRRWTRPLPAEPDRAILSNVWTTSTCYKPLEIERRGFVAFARGIAPHRAYRWLLNAGQRDCLPARFAGVERATAREACTETARQRPGPHHCRPASPLAAGPRPRPGPRPGAGPPRDRWSGAPGAR